MVQRVECQKLSLKILEACQQVGYAPSIHYNILFSFAVCMFNTNILYSPFKRRSLHMLTPHFSVQPFEEVLSMVVSVVHVNAGNVASIRAIKYYECLQLYMLYIEGKLI